jgi:hypothetical protein
VPFESPRHSEIHRSPKEADALITVDYDLRDNIVEAEASYRKSILDRNRFTLLPNYSPSKICRRTLTKVNNAPNVNLDSLYEHIKKTHPVIIDTEVKKAKRYGMCANLGNLSICHNKTTHPSDLAKELGIGATMFLISTRAMAWLFFALTIINIPVFAFYYNGTSTRAHKIDKSELVFGDYFAMLSLGNIGQSAFSCGNTNFSQIEADKNFETYANIELSCGYGSQLGKLLEIGLIKDDKAVCGMLYTDPVRKDVFDPKFKSNGFEVQLEG